jgi:WD40 repeat protein
VSTGWSAAIDDHVIALAWSLDGSTLAVAAASGPITLFDAASGAVRHPLPGHGFGTAAVAWSADGSLLASAGQDGRVRVWDRATGKERWSAAGGASWVDNVAWCPQAPILASIAGRKLRLWDDGGAPLREYPDHPSTIADLQWKPRSRELTVAHYGGLTHWSADRDEPLRRFAWQGSTLVIAWSGDHRHIATGDQDATVHFWITESGQDLQMWGYPTKVRELAWDATSRYLATGGGETIVVWDCSGKGPENSRPLMLNGHDQPLTALAFQNAGSVLASAGEDGRVVFWRPRRGDAPLTQGTGHGTVSRIAWSPDDRHLAVGTAAGAVEMLTAP